MQITITGDKAVMRKLKKLGDSIKYLPEEMRTIGQDLAQYYAVEGFASQGGIFGKPWPRLSTRYAAWKALNFSGRSLLERSGNMRKGFTFDATGTQVIIYNKEDYWKYHQTGTSRMPQRVTAGINDPVKQKVATIIKAGIERKLS